MGNSLLRSRYALDFVPAEDRLFIVNPGGKVKSILYEEDARVVPFTMVEGAGRNSKKVMELGTSRQMQIKRNDYPTFSAMQGQVGSARKKFVRNLVMYEQDILPEVSIPGDLKVMCFDFEMRTMGSMPLPERDPIIAFGAVMLNERWQDPDDNDIKIMISHSNEKKLLNAFIEYILEKDPDIVAGFFSMEFDLPYFYQRCAKYKIDLSILNRFAAEPPRKGGDRGFFHTKTGEMILTRCGESLGIGRVHDDIYLNSVKRDTNIKTKNRRLKTVTAFYGMEGIYDLSDDDKTQMDKISDEQMHKYLTSDIRCTAYLEEKYLPISLALSDVLNWPVNMAVNRSPGLLSDLYCGSMAWQRGYASVKNNAEKFPKVYQLIELSTNKKFEGAYNFAREYTASREVQKLDVSSLYPSIMIQFNLSPDTTTLQAIVDLGNKLGIDEGEDERYAVGVVKEQDFTIYNIPDYNLGKKMHIKVKNSSGVVKDMLLNFLNQRAQIRKQMKQTKDPVQLQLLDSRQNTMKILANSIYGSMSGGMFSNTSPIIGLFVTAIGRELASTIHRAYNDQILAIDTDGFMFNNQSIRDKDLNKFIEEFIKTKYEFPECHISVKEEMEAEGRNNIIIFKKKNYSLFTEGHVKLVGNSLHSSTMPVFVDEMIHDLMAKCLDDLNAGIFQAKRIDKYYADMMEKVNDLPTESFKLSMAVKIDIDDYKGTAKPSTRISYMNLSSSSEESRKNDIIAYIEKTIRDLYSKNEGDLGVVVSKWKKIKNAKTHEDFMSELRQFALLYLDNAGHFQYNQAVKILDRYLEKNGSYPNVGETVEFFYTNSSEKVELFENLKDRSQLNMQKYTGLFANTYESLIQCAGTDTDSFDDISF